MIRKMTSYFGVKIEEKIAHLSPVCMNILWARINSEMTGFIVENSKKIVQNDASIFSFFYYLLRASFRQSEALIVVAQ